MAEQTCISEMAVNELSEMIMAYYSLMDNQCNTMRYNIESLALFLDDDEKALLLANHLETNNMKVMEILDELVNIRQAIEMELEFCFRESPPQPPNC